MVSDEVSKDAQRNIILNWYKLSPGDVSIIEIALQSPGVSVVTTSTSAHGYFWAQVVRLEWAQAVEAPPGVAVPLVSFQLTDKGIDILKGFIAYRNLFELTAHNRTQPDEKLWWRYGPVT